MKELFKKYCKDCAPPLRCAVVEDYKEIVGCVSTYHFDEKKKIVTILLEITFFDRNFNIVHTEKRSEVNWKRE